MRSLRTITKLKRQVKVLRKQNAELRVQLWVQLMEQLRSLQECKLDDMTVDKDGVPTEVDRGKMFLVDMEEQWRRHLVDSGQLGRYVEEPFRGKVNSYDTEFEISQPIQIDAKVFKTFAIVAEKIRTDLKNN